VIIPSMPLALACHCTCRCPPRPHRPLPQRVEPRACVVCRALRQDGQPRDGSAIIAQALFS